MAQTSFDASAANGIGVPYKTPNTRADSNPHGTFALSSANGGQLVGVAATLAGGHTPSSESTPADVNDLPAYGQSGADGILTDAGPDSLQGKKISFWRKQSTRWGAGLGGVAGIGTGLGVFLGTAATFVVGGSVVAAAIVFTGGLAVAGALLGVGACWAIGKMNGKARAKDPYVAAPHRQVLAEEPVREDVGQSKATKGNAASLDEHVPDENEVDNDVGHPKETKVSTASLHEHAAAEDEAGIDVGQSKATKGNAASLDEHVPDEDEVDNDVGHPKTAKVSTASLNEHVVAEDEVENDAGHSIATKGNAASRDEHAAVEDEAGIDVGRPPAKGPQSVVPRTRTPVVQSANCGRSELAEHDQREVDRAFANAVSYANRENVNLDNRRKTAIRKGMEGMLSDRRAMFGNDYTDGEVENDLRCFVRSIVRDLQDLDAIKACQDEQSLAISRPLGKSSGPFGKSVLAAAKMNIDAITWHWMGDKGGETELTRAQNEWYVASAKWLRRGGTYTPTLDDREILQLSAFLNVASSQKSDNSRLFTEMANGYCANGNHFLRRLHDRMNRIAQIAQRKGATSVLKACEQQRSACKSTAHTIQMAAEAYDRFPELAPTVVADDQFAKGDKEIARETTRLLAYNATVACCDN